LIFANALSFVWVAAMVLAIPLDRTPRQQKASVGPRRALSVLRDHPYSAVALLNAFLTLHMTLLAIALPLWVSQHTRAPRELVAPLIVVNTALAFALQVRVARRVEDVRGASRALGRSGLALAACCGLFAIAAHLPAAEATGVLIAAVVALTAGEMLQSAGGWQASFALADPDRDAAYLALFSLGLAAQQVLGPTLLTAVVIPAGTPGWFGLGVLLASCGALCASAVRWSAGRQRLRPAELV
jgi:hypothetical protein